jgi:hypothetical protein
LRHQGKGGVDAESVDERQCDPDANTSREVSIGGQSSQQLEQVRKEVQRLLQEIAFGRRMTKAITSASQDSSKAAAKPTIRSRQIRPVTVRPQ